MVSTNQRDPLESGDVVIVALPSHIPRGHEQQGTRPAVVVGTVWGEVRYPTIAIVPVTTQTGSWSRSNPSLYPLLEAGAGGLSQSSIVLIDQVRALDMRRVLAYLGTLTLQQYTPILSGLRQFLRREDS